MLRIDYFLNEKSRESLTRIEKLDILKRALRIF